MVAVTTVLGHIWIPLAPGRAEHTGPIKSLPPLHRTVSGPSTAVSEEVERKKGGEIKRDRGGQTQKRVDEEEKVMQCREEGD